MAKYTEAVLNAAVGNSHSVAVSCVTWAWLVLQVEHINGNYFDDRHSNLRFLCPNCRTQCPTHSGSNKKLLGQRRLKRPPDAPQRDVQPAEHMMTFERP